MSKGFDFVYNPRQTTPEGLGARQSGRLVAKKAVFW